MKWMLVTDAERLPLAFELCAANHSEHKLAQPTRERINVRQKPEQRAVTVYEQVELQSAAEPVILKILLIRGYKTSGRGLSW